MKLANRIQTRGSRCSTEGRKYELVIYDIVSRCKINGTTQFNTQLKEDLAGCGAGNDIECNFIEKNDIPIEIKKMNTPDWMQCSLLYNTELNKWTGSSKNKIPNAAKHIFENLIASSNIFNGKIPPFMTNNITHEEWLHIKSETNDFNDTYMDCPNDTIANLYREKGCKYIQISNKGLYHLGDDLCNFQVPIFDCEQELRIRTKIHSRSNSKGFCNLSVTIACKPKNIKNLQPSVFSLDNIQMLPNNLTYLS